VPAHAALDHIAEAESCYRYLTGGSERRGPV